MENNDKLTHRLTLLEGVEFSPADREAIANEIEDNLRVVAELEEFGEDSAWISHQAQPANRKA
ncbi:MAG: hypothetical protein EXR70_21600 [Deltaproteobacteria bacterium]|nr:hypothetical protein [Deltaproteobacteria bacterium]